MRGFALLSCVPLLFGCAGGGTVASESGPQNTIDTTIQAASRNDNAAIAASFTPAARQIYQPFFSDPAKMREFGDSLARSEKIDRTDSFAVYKSTFVNNGGAYTYFIYMVKDESGNWKFDRF